MLYLAADHGGFDLKNSLKKYLKELGYQYQDLGAEKLKPDDDYPDYAKLVAAKIQADKQSLGILICSTGLGMCLAANKIRGIRAVSPFDEQGAQQSRQHLNANILCLGERLLSQDQAKKIVKVWLEAEFSGEERHIRRLRKIEKLV